MDTTQLPLLDTSKYAPPKPTSRSEEADALGISLLELLQQEEKLNAEFYGLAYPERREAVFWLGKPLEYIRYDRFVSGDLPAKPKGLHQIRQAWSRQKQEETPKKRRKQRPMQPWSECRLIANRCARLRDRMEKRYGIKELRDTAIWDAVLQNPEYFGVCPLPSEDRCEINPGQLLARRDKALAIEKENAMRDEVP